VDRRNKLQPRKKIGPLGWGRLREKRERRKGVKEKGGGGKKKGWKGEQKTHHKKNAAMVLLLCRGNGNPGNRGCVKGLPGNSCRNTEKQAQTTLHGKQRESRIH